MKKLVLILLVACLLLGTTASYATEVITTAPSLSNMSEEDCLTFLLDQGLSIPNELKDYDKLAWFVKEVATTVESDPNHIFFYNYSVTLNFANSIKEIVNAYYNNISILAFSPSATARSYTLVHSEPVGEWDEVFTEYNCYAYALFYNSSPLENSAYFAPSPGYFSDYEGFNILDPIINWITPTYNDLKAEGYQCVHSTTDYNEAMALSDTHNIICLRKGDHPDFHFMRWDTTSWYHKPGNTHILRYLYYRPDLYEWTNEVSFRGVDYPGTFGKSYSGTVYYFAFKSAHNYVYDGRTGNEYHAGSKHFFENQYTCSDCGETTYIWTFVACSGPPCLIAHSTPSDEEVMS